MESLDEDVNFQKTKRAVRTAGKRVDENPMVATDALDEPLLAVPGASSHSTHRFERTQKIT